MTASKIHFLQTFYNLNVLRQQTQKDMRTIKVSSPLHLNKMTHGKFFLCGIESCLEKRFCAVRNPVQDVPYYG